MRKLALGTAQIGQSYGVANVTGKIPADAVSAILQRASLAGIDTLDTAVAYGDSEQRLGAAGASSWRVVTKLPALPHVVDNVSEWATELAARSLQRLKVEQLDGLLLHKPADLTGPNGVALADTLRTFKERGWVRSVGVSIYDPAELDLLWPKWRPEIVQAPCNVLDRRLIRSGWLARLSEQGIRVHLRSVFLQGLLLMPSAERPVWFGRWRALLDEWVAWCRQHEVSALHAALAFACDQPGIERVVVGVDSVAQLDEILAAVAGVNATYPLDLWSDDPGLIEPSRWKLT